MIANWLRDRFKNTEFDRDKAFVKRYADVDLTRAQFDQYADQGTLRSRLGTDAALEERHHGYGTPRGVGNGEILGRILFALEESGITLEAGPRTPLGRKISEALGACISANLWLNVPDKYMLPTPVEERMRSTFFWLNQKPA